MKLASNEYYAIMDMFERSIGKGERKDREHHDQWPRGNIYQDGHVNRLFQAYLSGYAFRDSLANLEKAS